MATNTPGGQSDVLFAQQTAQPSDIQTGWASQPPAPDTFSVNAYSDNGLYELLPAGYNPSSETGLQEEAGARVEDVTSTNQGSAAVEVNPDTSLGVVLNSDEQQTSTGGAEPVGNPEPLIPIWTPQSVVDPFAGGAQSINVSLDVQVPYSEAPGEGSTVSSNQMVLYLTMTNMATGKTIALGEQLFDSRGVQADYSGVDDGTGEAVLTVPAGEQSPYDTVVSGTAPAQGEAFGGLRTFDFQVTQQNMQAVIAKLNSLGGEWSTNPADYQLDTVSVDSEIEYFGQPNSFAYSLADLDVSTGNTVGSLTSTTPDTDSSLLSGNHDQYSIALQNGALNVQDDVAGRDGSRLLAAGTEAQFTDGVGVADPTGVLGLASRAYQAVTGSLPTASALESFASLTSASEDSMFFLDTPQYGAALSADSNAQFVAQLYQNALGRQPDAATFEADTMALSAGYTRTSLISAIITGGEDEGRDGYPADGSSNPATSGGSAEATLVNSFFKLATGQQGSAAQVAAFTNVITAGVPVSAVAATFASIAGVGGVAEFVQTVFSNLLGSPPDAGTAQTWTAFIQGGGLSEGAALQALASTPQGVALGSSQSGPAVSHPWAFALNG
jgi:hypothetical protein